MMHTGWAWCHDCDTSVDDWSEFVRHANRGHAITDGRCLGPCQFPSGTGSAAKRKG